MNTKTHTQTEAVILGMLTENTGRSIVDSGGESGRAWQQNQVLGIEALAKAPAVTFDYGTPRISVYHFLTEHLEYAPMLDAAYSVWDDTHPDEGWLDTVESFLDTFGVGQNGGFYESGRFTLNTYEMEYCFLSQVLQFTKFDLAGVDYLALQIHGGADVRGGYTKPRIFKMRDFETFFLAMESATVKCLSCKLELEFCVDSLEIETGNMENEEHAEKMEALDNREIREWLQDYQTANECPNCGESGTITGVN